MDRATMAIKVNSRYIIYAVTCGHILTERYVFVAAQGPTKVKSPALQTLSLNKCAGLDARGKYARCIEQLKDGNIVVPDGLIIADL